MDDIFNQNLIDKAMKMATGEDIHSISAWCRWYEHHHKSIGKCLKPESEPLNKELMLEYHQRLVDYVSGRKTVWEMLRTI